MTKDEYHQLAKSSDSFKNSAPELQQKILSAKGEDRKTYAKIFLDEKERLVKENENLAFMTNEAIKSFEKDAARSKKKYLNAMESGSKKEEEENVEELFNSIH